MLLNFSEKLMPLALDSGVLSVCFGWVADIPETNMTPKNTTLEKNRFPFETINVNITIINPPPDLFFGFAQKRGGSQFSDLRISDDSCLVGSSLALGDLSHSGGSCFSQSTCQCCQPGMSSSGGSFLVIPSCLLKCIDLGLSDHKVSVPEHLS